MKKFHILGKILYSLEKRLRQQNDSRKKRCFVKNDAKLLVKTIPFISYYFSIYFLLLFVKLIIQPHTFRKNHEKRGKALFYCVECEKIGHFVSASAEKIDDKTYHLINWPEDSSHKCTTDKCDFLVKEFMAMLLKKVRENPLFEC